MLICYQLFEITKDKVMKAVIFDNNGTLLDDLDLAFGSVAEIFNTYSLPPPTLEQYRQEITSKFMQFYYDHGFPLTTTMEELNNIRKRYYKDNAHRAKFREDVYYVLRRLEERGIKLAIVSAEIESVLMERLNEAKIRHYFGNNIKAGVYGNKEPALIQVVKDLDVNPEDAVYVDDTVDGTGAAKNVGIVPVAFGNGYNSPERLLTVTSQIIYQLSDLLKLLK